MHKQIHKTHTQQQKNTTDKYTKKYTKSKKIKTTKYTKNTQ